MKHVSNIKKISKQRNRNYEIKTSKHTDLILTELTLEKDFKQFFSNIFRAHSLDNYQNGRATNLSDEHANDGQTNVCNEHAMVHIEKIIKDSEI